MADSLQTIDDDLKKLGIVGSYNWKPQRMFVRNPEDGAETAYISIDVVSDGSTSDISRAILEEGMSQINQIRSVASELKKQIALYERDYTTVRSNLIKTYQRMYNYFMGQDLIALGTIMATAIVNLNLL